MQDNALQKLNEAKENEKKSLFWEAAQKYQEALLEFNKTSGNESEKSLCKKKIREMNVEKSKEFVKSSKTAPGFKKILIPGEPESRLIKERNKKGIFVDDETWRQIKNRAEELKINIR